MPAKTYLRLLQGGLILSLFCVLFVFKDLLFPYITSKQLPFNILMEVLFAIWLVFIMRYPEYRPKKNYISYGLIFYFLAILASCLVSVNFTLSFWGNAERMLGFFHIFHFLIFYYILITVFRTKAEWKTLLLFSIAIAVMVSLKGLAGPSYSTIGNTAYVSGYLIFNLFFAVILLLKEKSFLRWLYLVPLFLMFLEFRNMRTSGAIIGLGLGILLLFFLLGLSHYNKKVRRGSLIVFIVAVIGVIAIFSQYQAAWFQNSFLRSLTSQKTTFQTRLISWRGAAADFKYHPVFGTGFGNYAIIFDKHFDPKFFNYMKTDTYFDRAHNNLIDITSTTGVVGLVTYLSIFIAVLYYLWQEFSKNGRRAGGDALGMKNLEIIVILALLAAYFVQNLAIFDSFVTYLGLMVTLGYIYSLAQQRQKEEAGEEGEKKYFLVLKTKNQEILALVIMLIAAYIFTTQFNVKPWRMFQGVINGYAQMAEGNPVAGFNSYQATFTGNPLERDGRVTLINLVIGNPTLLASLKPPVAQSLLDYTISLAQKNLSDNPQDSLNQMQLAQVLDTAARFNIKDLRLFNYYSRQAMEAVDASIESSPRRIPVYFTKAQIQLVRGENDDAINTLKYAIGLNTNYPNSYCRLAQFYSILNVSKEIGPVLDRCLDLDGVTEINSDRLLKSFITYYANQKDYKRALILAERLADLYDKDAEVWFNLSKLYLVLGEKDKANVAAQKAIQLDAKYEKLFQEVLNFFNTTTVPVAK